ncbi:MAG: hypothetical protein IKR07_05395 [Oscillospiraceae bacterium]|nr:hypothetical protein [Oscillospiraceae bacterium]
MSELALRLSYECLKARIILAPSRDLRRVVLRELLWRRKLLRGSGKGFQAAQQRGGGGDFRLCFPSAFAVSAISRTRPV